MSAAGTNDRVPQLDLRRFDAGEAARVVFLEELRAAAHGVGFFYIAGHGVETAMLRDLMHTTRRFFALPEADKLAISAGLARADRHRRRAPRTAARHRLTGMVAAARPESMARRAAGAACGGHPLAGRRHADRPRPRTRSAKPIVPRGWTELHEGAAAVPSRCRPAPSRRFVEIGKISIESARNTSNHDDFGLLSA
jgi:non-haem dioxygenase in morphine synthesis N-terminal